MVSVLKLRQLLSQIRQKRHNLEKHVEQIPKMLPACLIMRYRQRNSKKYESLKKIGRGTAVKSYAYLTFLEGGVNRHRYVAKEKIGEVARLTQSFLRYSQAMKQIRFFNKRIVELLDKIGKIQTEEIKKYVSKKTKNAKRVSQKARGKQTSKRTNNGR